MTEEDHHHHQTSTQQNPKMGDEEEDHQDQKHPESSTGHEQDSSTGTGGPTHQTTEPKPTMAWPAHEQQQQQQQDPHNNHSKTRTHQLPSYWHPGSSEPKPEPKHKGPRQALCACTVALLLIMVGITSLILWLIYRPHKPHFTLSTAAIYTLNATSSPPFVSTTSMQFTIITTNGNDRLSMFYDRLSCFVSYRNQAITPRLELPALRLDRHTSVALSPALGGEVPVSLEVAKGLEMDKGYGVVGLSLVLVGKVRWKGRGGLKTGRYGVYVKCDVLLGFNNGFVGQVPFLRSPHCNVDF